MEMLGRLAIYRVRLLEREFVRPYGTTVQSGPFAGMRFLPKTPDSCLMPKLLGCYEADLHRHVVAALDRGYDTVINIGCAEGYYAVGFARLLPAIEVCAFDTEVAARAAFPPRGLRGLSRPLLPYSLRHRGRRGGPEWRGGPLSWAVMRARKLPPA
jgi:hypothetical protein